MVTSSDRYVWMQQPCYYLEAENVTIIDDTWVVQSQLSALSAKPRWQFGNTTNRQVVVHVQFCVQVSESEQKIGAEICQQL